MYGTKHFIQSTGKDCSYVAVKKKNQQCSDWCARQNDIKCILLKMVSELLYKTKAYKVMSFYLALLKQIF